MTQEESEGVEYEPANQAQQRFLNTTTRNVCFSAGVGAGKTYTGCLKTYKHLLLHPGSRAVIIRKERTMVKDSTLQTFLEIVPQTNIASYNKNEGVIHLYTTHPTKTSEVWLRGVDKRQGEEYPQKLGSTEFSLIYVDEGIELERGDWAFLNTRARYQTKTMKEQRVKPQIITTTNPSGPMHWMHDMFIENPESDYEIIYTTPYDNPYLDSDYLETLEKTLTGSMKQRLLHGEWVKATGTIYTYEPRHHFTTNLPKLNTYDDIVIGMDSNYPLPRSAVIIGYKKNTEEYHVHREYYEKNSQPRDLAKHLQKTLHRHGIDLSQVLLYHDPSDPSTIQRVRKILGRTVHKAKNSVIPGITRVDQKFQDGTMMIHKRCENLIRELSNYTWKTKGERPVKENDHLMDALRYAVYTHSEGTTSRFLKL